MSVAETPDELRADLVDELQTLAAADPAEIETTLLIHPRVFSDFLDYIRPGLDHVGPIGFADTPIDFGETPIDFGAMPKQFAG